MNLFDVRSRYPFIELGEDSLVIKTPSIYKRITWESTYQSLFFSNLRGQPKNTSKSNPTEPEILMVNVVSHTDDSHCFGKYHFVKAYCSVALCRMCLEDIDCRETEIVLDSTKRKHHCLQVSIFCKVPHRNEVTIGSLIGNTIVS
jgi:hypothetical protein